MTSNFFIPYGRYSQNITKIVMYSLTRFVLGGIIAFIGHELIFDTALNYTFVYISLFFGVIAIVIAWLYFNRLENQEALEKIKQKLSDGNTKYLLWIKATDAKGVIFLINVKDIKYFKPQDKYTNIYTQDKAYLINTGIKLLINQLDLNYFWTIHRGTIVNLEFISKISKNKQDKLMVHLDDDTALSVSRNHINLFKKM